MDTTRSTTPTARRLAPLAALLTLAGSLAAPAGASAAAKSSTTATQRSAAAKAAVAKVGRPYRLGATGPRAFDCSGLVGFAYRVAKRPLSVRTSHQMWNLGTHVRRAALRPGDLVFTWDRAHGHVGVFIGGGRYVHAPRPERTVEIAPLPGGQGYVGAVRP